MLIVVSFFGFELEEGPKRDNFSSPVINDKVRRHLV